LVPDRSEAREMELLLSRNILVVVSAGSTLEWVADTIGAMRWDGNYRMILVRLKEGQTFQQAAESVGISRQSVWKRIKAYPEFAQAVQAVREAGKAEREFRMWLHHPFRGKRPPSGKGHGGKPVFTWGLGAGCRRSPRG